MTPKLAGIQPLGKERRTPANQAALAGKSSGWLSDRPLNLGMATHGPPNELLDAGAAITVLSAPRPNSPPQKSVMDLSVIALNYDVDAIPAFLYHCSKQ